MLRTKRRRWLLVAALFFLAAAAAIAQMVTAQGEEASGVRHIIRTNASGELVIAGGGVGQVEGTTADGAAFTDNPVVIGGVDNAGDVRQILTATSGVVATGEALAAVDGASNAGAGLPVLGTGAGFYQPIFPMAFNGATWDRQFLCSESAPISTVGAGTTEIIALAGTTIIRICHISLSWDAVVDFRIVEGTGVNCADGTSNITANYLDLSAIALDMGADAALRSSAGGAICITQTGAGNSGGVITYAQF